MEEFQQKSDFGHLRYTDFELVDAVQEDNIDCDKDTPSNDKNFRTSQQDDEEIKVLGDDEISRSDALSMIPNCYKRNKVTLTVPSLEFLPYRAWPKKKIYIIEIQRPKLFKGNLSLLKAQYDNRNTSAISIDDDIEIVDVITSQGEQISTSEMQKQDYEYSRMVAEKADVAEESCDTTKVVGFRSEFSNPPLLGEVPQPPVSYVYLNETVAELRKRVYRKLIHRDYEGPSRGFYVDQDCLLGPAIQGCSNMGGSDEGRRTFNSEIPETFDKGRYNRPVDRDQVGIHLNFRPSKRYPIIRQDQCLPCDAQWLSDMLKKNEGHQSENYAPAAKTPRFQRDGQACNKKKNRSPHQTIVSTSHGYRTGSSIRKVLFKYYTFLIN